MSLTEHFTLAELCHTDTGLPNVPDDAAMLNLARLAGLLEGVRAVLGHPMHINSAYRSEAANAAVGGAHNSAHTKGLAADIVCPEFGTPGQICLAIVDSGLKFEQLILEKTWAHISVGETGKRQVLTCTAPGKYVPGLQMTA